ncbi:hypothetical protein YC2023_115634 [Brassica napus]
MTIPNRFVVSLLVRRFCFGCCETVSSRLYPGIQKLHKTVTHYGRFIELRKEIKSRLREFENNTKTEKERMIYAASEDDSMAGEARIVVLGED